uniref:G-protein coupled receptors family 1 profile domain-containing protein n=1 Tax=Neogobius melanostomus TaxID=47308 RepID=A0A8C6WYR9_9GOBI
MMDNEASELCFPLLNSSCRKPQTHMSEAVSVYAVLSILSLLTTALNLLVIISIAHFRQLHSATNFILFSLGVSDFFVGLVVIPTDMFMWRRCWVLGDLLCVLYFTLTITVLMASVTSMVLISVDRYMAICYPMHYHSRDGVKVVSITIPVCWVYAVCYAFFLFQKNFSNLGKYRSCHGECVAVMEGDADLILAFVIPICIIVVLYMRVFVVAVSQARAMRSHVTAATLQSTKSKKSDIKAARNLGILVLVFLICYCPYYIVVLSGGHMVGASLEAVMAFVMYVNSCLNPLIYALFYPWFRKAIKSIITLQILSPGSCDLMLT